MSEEQTLLKNMSHRREVISVLGMGHVGLPTALGLADLGWTVVGVDSDKEKIRALCEGQLPFYEPGLEEMFHKHQKSGRFRISDDVEQTINDGRILFICVGTPQGEQGDPDLSQVEAVAQAVARNLNGYKIIIEKSTVPAVTGQWIRRTVERYSKSGGGTTPPVHFEVASNPEFLREGSALNDFLQPDRIVCGVESDTGRKILEEIYRDFNCPVLFTNLPTAEIIKHAGNSFLATKISFINMVADLCEVVGADVSEVARGIGLDPRIGPRFLDAGIGFGGYCLPKDLRAFAYLGDGSGADFSLLREVEKVNASRIDRFMKKIRDALWVLRGKTVGVLGLSFKPGTDDIREAPSLKIIEKLLAEGVALRLHDPQAAENVRSWLHAQGGEAEFCETPYGAAEGVHALLILTEWDEYGSLDLKRLAGSMDVPLVIDGRNMFVPADMKRAGFEYISIGRPRG